jgi:hypothetical protein
MADVARTPPSVKIIQQMDDISDAVWDFYRAVCDIVRPYLVPVELGGICASDSWCSLLQEFPHTPSLPPVAFLLIKLRVHMQVCQVHDAAEFCRNSHTKPAWRKAAQQTCSSLGGNTPPPPPSHSQDACIWNMLRLQIICISVENEK